LEAAAGALGFVPLGLAGFFLACAGGWTPTAGFSVLMDAIFFSQMNTLHTKRVVYGAAASSIILRLSVKYFLENIFCIFRCLVQQKMMVSKNHFQFNRKNLFNF
jgi:hypothetical protein